MIEILDPGPFASIQDRGRPGFASVGVPRSGAFDRGAFELANRLVGNARGAACVEFTLGGLMLAVQHAVTVALTGAEAPGLDWGVAISLPAGARVRFGTPSRGLRSYLAVRGGIDTPAELESRSTDTLSGLGPRPLAAGDRLRVGISVSADVLGAAATPQRMRALRVVAGPRDEWVIGDVVEALTSASWVLGADSDRIGLRLDGARLDRRAGGGELASEPTLPGAVQLPPDGRPIIFGPDAPVTGGYPVVAVVRRTDMDIAAQLRPGDPVVFTG
ncbi:MAG TPA: biotin-dependent carboxyltransferase family protein [Jatrophihabitantaceae bacterium]|nr:biotin-dependent carboxyltransferase family protein [Jatrophihabitantaceae bacterium]